MATFSALLVLCAGNSPVTGEFPAQRSMTPNFDVFFICALNKRLSEAGDLKCRRAHYDVIMVRANFRKSRYNVMTWKRLPHYWLFVTGSHGLPLDSSHSKPFLVFALLLNWTSYWTNNLIAGYSDANGLMRCPCNVLFNNLSPSA